MDVEIALVSARSFISRCYQTVTKRSKAPIWTCTVIAVYLVETFGSDGTWFRFAIVHIFSAVGADKSRSTLTFVVIDFVNTSSIVKAWVRIAVVHRFLAILAKVAVIAMALKAWAIFRVAIMEIDTSAMVRTHIISIACQRRFELAN
jgi:hypothetical protein